MSAVVNDPEVKEVDEAQAETPKAMPLWKRLYFFLLPAFVMLGMTVTNASAGGYQETPPDPATGFNIPVETIMSSFWAGADVVFGLTGLIGLIALPYGINFAFQFLTSIFNRFTSAIRI